MNDPSLRPTDVDPGKFQKALWIYFFVGIIGITIWQFWRHGVESEAFREAEAREQQISDDFTRIERAIVAFRKSEAREPESLNDIVGFADLDAIPIDPWSQRPYRYFTKDERFGVYTLGADDEEGGDAYDRDQYLAP